MVMTSRALRESAQDSSARARFDPNIRRISIDTTLQPDKLVHCPYGLSVSNFLGLSLRRASTVKSEDFFVNGFIWSSVFLKLADDRQVVTVCGEDGCNNGLESIKGGGRLNGWKMLVAIIVLEIRSVTGVISAIVDGFVVDMGLIKVNGENRLKYLKVAGTPAASKAVIGLQLDIRPGKLSIG